MALGSAEKSGVSARTGIPTLEPHGGACVCACVCPSEGVSLVCVPLCTHL